MGFGWPDCPAETRAQVDGFVEGCREALGGALANVTLHGSLAMGCFNPALSDVDLLVVSTGAPAPEERWAFAKAALAVAAGCEIETSLVRAGELEPFVHPMPFDVHVPGKIRADLERRVREGPRGFSGAERRRDPDLAAHVVMGIARGVTLAGRPLRELCPGVPVEDLVDALARDHDDIRRDPIGKPTYTVLNSCRLLRFALEGMLSSKEEGGAWALDVVPGEHRSVVEHALDAYRGSRPNEGFDGAAVRAVVEWIGVRVDQLRGARGW